MSLRVYPNQVIAVGSPPSPREGLRPSTPQPSWLLKIEKGFYAGMRGLTDPGFVIPMAFSQGVFGLSRLGFLRLMPQGVSSLAKASLAAFGLEGLALVGSTRGIHHLMEREVPETNFGNELGHAYLTVGLLKTLGGLTHSALHLRYHKVPASLLSLQDKIILKAAPQAAQFGGIYLSHTLAPGFGLGPYMDPGERALQSAATLVHFGFAGLLLNRIPGYVAANQKIYQQTQKLGEQIKHYWNDHSTLPIRSLAAAGVGPIGPRPVRSLALRDNKIWMNASNKDGSGNDEPEEITLIPISDSQPPSGRTVKRGKTSSIDLTMRSIPHGDPAPDPLLGQIIDGRYQFERVLGEGGMGKVYLARHQQLEKNVAIKVLLKELASRQDMNQRFINEARAATRIGNPHIIEVSDFGQLPDGSTYFVMEYLKGRSLGELTSLGKPLPLVQLLNISLQATEAMASAHEANIVHRDLKPDNIFLSQRGSDMEFVKILDFGIAKTSTDNKLTIPGQVFGSPDYISPEQASGQKVDHRGDIYSMGVILYEMATGRVPFIAEDYGDVLNMHLTQHPPSPRSLVSNPKDLPPGLEAVILKSLRKKPEERYQNMTELNAELRLIEEGVKPAALFSLAPEALHPPEALHSRTWIKDWRIWAGLFGAALAGGATANLLRKDREEADPPMPSVPPPPPDKKDLVNPPIKIEEPSPTSSRRVEISVEPADAHVFFEGKDLGKGSASLEIPAGGKFDVEVRKRGFKPEKLALDGSEPEISVKLKPARSGVPVATSSAIPKSSSTSKPSSPSKPSSSPKSPPTPPPSRQDDIVRPW